MQTFEEQYTAWIDGRLMGAELEAFERTLEAQGRPAAETDREDAQRLGRLLRRHAVAPALARPETFQSQLAQRMAGDTEEAPVPASERSFWSLPNLAWAAAVCLLLSFAVYRSTDPAARSEQTIANATPFAPSPIAEARIIQASTDDPNIFATSLHSAEDDMAVVWLDGLDYLPASYQLQ